MFPALYPDLSLDPVNAAYEAGKHYLAFRDEELGVLEYYVWNIDPREHDEDGLDIPLKFSDQETGGKEPITDDLVHDLGKDVQIPKDEPRVDVDPVVEDISEYVFFFFLIT